MPKTDERKEALIRILVGIVSGIVINIWQSLVGILAFFHFFYVLIAGKRNKSISKFSMDFVQAQYDFTKYMLFSTNRRAFPFEDLRRPLDKVE